MGIKRLHYYQQRLVKQLLAVPATQQEIGVVYPQGSGKTLILLCYAALALGSRVSHVLVVCPQGQISDAWRRPSGLWSVGGGLCVNLDDLVDLAGEGLTGTVENVCGYLKLPRADRVLIAQHATLTWSRPGSDGPALLDSLPQDLSGYVLVIDEAHRNRAVGLSRIRTVWLARGGTVIDVTATPYRTDRQPVMGPTARVFSRSYALHAVEGYAPSNIETAIIPVPVPAAATDGLDKDAWIEHVCDRVVAQWSQDGRPKAVVHVPAIAREDSGEDSGEPFLHEKIVNRLGDLFRARGVPVFAAFDRQRSDMVTAQFIEMLRQERDRAAQGYAASKYDVILAVRRMDEGTDWPFCSAVYFIDMPGAQWIIEQVFGRATRDKRTIPGYPAAWVDRVRVAFFIADADTAVRKHPLSTFISACMLADHGISQRIANLRRIKTSLERAIGHRAGRIVRQIAEMCDVPADVSALIEGSIIATSSRDPAVIERHLAASGKPVAPSVLAGYLALRDGSSAEAVAGAYVGRHRDRDPYGLADLDTALLAAFEEPSKQFAHGRVTAAYDERTKAIIASLARFDAQEASEPAEVARKYLQLAATPLDLTDIQVAVRKFVDERRVHPMYRDGPVRPGLMWSEVVAAVLEGARGLPRYDSWNHFCRDALGADAKDAKDAWADDYAAVVGVEYFDLTDDASVRAKMMRAYPKLSSKDAPALCRAVHLFGADLVASLGAEAAVPLGDKKVWKQLQGQNRRAIDKLRRDILARRDRGETFQAGDVRRELKRHIDTAG